jgi:formylglycine-generating enzyme required for sulfatase activity
MYNERMFKKVVVLVIFGVFLLQSAFSQLKNEMIRVESGSFLMGSPEGEAGSNPVNEAPQHRASVSAFMIAKYPVTQAEYQEVIGTNPSINKGPLTMPVDNVSWNMAVDYCNKRSVKEGLTPVYTINGNNVTWDRGANGYRLPTEAEWEYACRAGTTTPFSSGESMDDTGWHRDNSVVVLESGARNRSSYPVGEKKANAWGIHDMHGNVLEWCWDYFAPYTAEARVDSSGPDKPLQGNTWRVYRGGCFDYVSAWCRSAYRFRQHQNFRMFYNGFRIARNAENTARSSAQ